MTPTFCTARLLFSTFVDVRSIPLLWTVSQIAAVLAISYFWRRAIGPGPLEKFVAGTSKTCGRMVVRNTP